VLLRNGQVSEPVANFLSPAAVPRDSPPLDPTEEFVRFLYEVVLDRTDVDAPAVQHWVTKLETAEFTKAELFAHFLLTPEGRRKFDRNPYFAPLLNVWDPAPSFSRFTSGVAAIERAQIVDVGAMILDFETDVYEPLVTSGKWDVVGFEPNRAEAVLRQERHPEQCVIPDALGDGNGATLHINQGVATSSLLESDTERLEELIGLSNWMVTVREENLSTRRLDDIAEVSAPALLKLDVQGGELLVLESAVRTLEGTLVVHVETEFFPMYKDQPLFRDIDAFLSENGFEFFSFSDQFRYYCNDRIESDTRAWPATRLVWTDSIFVPITDRIDTLSLSETMSLCWVMHDLYNAYDYAAWVLGRFDDRHGSAWRTTYLEFVEQEF
jgi:FkbM family methyltransferase